MAKGNQNNQGGQQNQPPVSARVVSDAAIVAANGTYSWSVLVTVTKGTNVGVGEVVILSGATQKYSGSLDAAGTLRYTHNELADFAGKTADLSAVFTATDGKTAKADFQLMAPAKPKSKNAEYMAFTSLFDDVWVPTLSIRVLDGEDKGMGNQIITLKWCGQTATITTDTLGMAEYVMTEALKEGEDRVVTATVNGIKSVARLTLSRPEASKLIRRGDDGWLFGTNNGRALILRWLFFVITIGMLFYGIGDPVLAPEKLTVQQDMYNQVQSLAHGQGFVAIPVPMKSSSHIGLWVAWLAIGLSILIYSLAAMREEIYEVLRDFVRNMLRSNSTHVSDPVLERLANKIGLMSVARNHAPIAKEVDSQSKRDKSHGFSWMELLGVEFTGEMLAEIVPFILRKLITG